MQQLWLTLQEVKTQLVHLIHDTILLRVGPLSLFQLLSFEQFTQVNMFILLLQSHFIFFTVNHEDFGHLVKLL